MKQASNLSPNSRVKWQQDNSRDQQSSSYQYKDDQLQYQNQKKNTSPIRQQQSNSSSKLLSNSTASILERLKEKQSQPPKLVISGNGNQNGNNQYFNSPFNKSSSSLRQISNGKSPKNYSKYQQQPQNESEVIEKINQSPEKLQIHEQYLKYSQEQNNGRSSNLSIRTPTSPQKQQGTLNSFNQNQNNSGLKKMTLENKSLNFIPDNQEQYGRHLNKSNSEMIASNVLEKIVDLEIKLKKELIKNQHLETQVDSLNKQNDKLSKLNHDLTMQNSNLVNQITTNDSDNITPSKQTSKKQKNSNNNQEAVDSNNSSMSDINAKDVNYIKSLENECNKLQVLLEQKNKELQSWMQRYIEMQKKKEQKFEESETFNIMKKQIEKYEEYSKKQGEQTRIIENQKSSNERLIENLKDEVAMLKGERDTWMNKYQEAMKQNNKRDQDDNYEFMMVKQQKDEIQLKLAQLTDQFNEQNQFLQEQKQWTEHWKNKAVQLETKVLESQKQDNSKYQQKIDELETRIQKLMLENQNIKSNVILENQIQESERYARVNAEKQEIQSQYKQLQSKLELLAMEFKNEREEKNQLANQLDQFKNENTEMRINYEKKVTDLENGVKEKANIIEQMKKQEKEDQIKEINNRQQQEIETLKMRNKIVQIETELGNAKIELEKSQSKTKDYQRELDTWSKKCEALERQHKQQIEELNQHHSQLKQSNIEKEVKATKLESEGKIFYLDNQVKIMTKEVQIWKEKCQSLELEYEESIKLKNTEITESQNKIQLLNQKNLTSLNELNEKYDKEQKAQQEKIAEQKHQIKILQQQIEQIQLENQSLQENSIKRIRELQDIAQKAQQDIQGNSYSQLDTKIKQLQRQLLQLEIEKNQEIDEKNQQISQLEGDKSQLKEKIQLYSQEIKNLVSYLDKEKQNVEDLQKQISQAQREKDDLENQMNDIKDQFEHKSANCDFLLSENEQLNKQITGLKIKLNHSQNVQQSRFQQQQSQQQQQEIRQVQQTANRLNQSQQYQQSQQQKQQFNNQNENQQFILQGYMNKQDYHQFNNISNQNQEDSNDNQ
ncbi:hypothetical protein TTHERM_00633140 (macronuclear) [Tetrahymena thermophila SB210]|uniref:Uncharacterized protein n=1 Tax=Tetrahymena thermophila (strain SB210) TaxID=312017 RepID=Q22X39_TETTS|nr:hypothetical protein TTHERM_00633140 [Tetrahymena thermophila SB210]EAR89807.2 hypothetical protein TTHERM_00633140 [Tetrahymena thermophila SB210]|eukprot:XP_001010052.2 hypothetical protein TTHERM_00633140 [Tetrahymena thermophila SB210]